jgi:hypothetical protein
MDARSELVPPPGDAPGRPSVGRLVFRLAIGGTTLAGEWLGAALRAIDELPPPAVEPPAPDGGGARAVLVGALSSAMRWRPPPAPIPGAARRAGRVARRGLGLLANLPGGRLVRRRYARARADLAARTLMWAEEGAREERAGRRLARRAAPAFFELAAARFAESPELRLVIEQQSEGIAAGSIGELRARAEQADGAVERVMRRVLRRRPRH